MEDFNIFKPILKKSIRIGMYHILAKEGSTDNFIANYRYIGGKKFLFTCMKDRVRESDRMTKCTLLVYDSSINSIDEKCTYKNNNGVYFKKFGKAHYI